MVDILMDCIFTAFSIFTAEVCMLFLYFDIPFTFHPFFIAFFDSPVSIIIIWVRCTTAPVHFPEKLTFPFFRVENGQATFRKIFQADFLVGGIRDRLRADINSDTSIPERVSWGNPVSFVFRSCVSFYRQMHIYPQLPANFLADQSPIAWTECIGYFPCFHHCADGHLILLFRRCKVIQQTVYFVLLELIKNLRSKLFVSDVRTFKIQFAIGHIQNDASVNLFCPDFWQLSAFLEMNRFCAAKKDFLHPCPN